LSAAVDALGEVLAEMRVSPLFRTEPLSEVPQPAFWNAAVTGVTALLATELLAVAKALEWAVGRRRGARFGPRPLDVDLLLHGDAVITTPELQVPHPRLAERRFYLEPLARIAPRLRVPPGSRTVEELLARAPTDQGVREVPWRLPPAAFGVAG
jgi:2-amino-4-hydroxy-6-hydroxymethyldihydropteridine diphosphokinase